MASSRPLSPAPPPDDRSGPESAPASRGHAPASQPARMLRPRSPAYPLTSPVADLHYNLMNSQKLIFRHFKQLQAITTEASRFRHCRNS